MNERAQTESIESEFVRYRMTAEKCFEQLSDEELNILPTEDTNSIAMLVNHISGNLKSRFTDFLTSDGEKPWRNRDGEFQHVLLNRTDLMLRWNEGLSILFASLAELSDADLERKVVIRGNSLPVFAALLRSIAHFSYHVGQIVLISRHLRRDAWSWISIPKGESEVYNQNPDKESNPG